MKEALYYSKLENQQVQCHLCPHECRIADQKTGICNVRQNKEGVLYSLVYERAIATHIDPIEKKPLFHVYPASHSLSIATAGCNFRCMFCQNCDISQVKYSDTITGERIQAKDIVRAAHDNQCRTIAFTYTEPTIFFEYALDIAKEAAEKQIKCVFISNGFINPEPMKQLAPFLAGANIDLKGWDESFYRKIIGGRLEPVLNTLKLLKQLGVWLEVTTLIVPGYADSEQTLQSIAQFIKTELGPETPWHISRFHPQYKMTDRDATPTSVIKKAVEMGSREGLRYVYSGNIPGDDGEHTHCYSCGAMLLKRYGFRIIENNVRNGKCSECGAEIDGVFA
ncbi:MAG: AmmeMemoRadiSam system radical SAM enzyme [candidate division KSB1 bacterium]|nr:AmmeMemoRadiSam system radical SAM enzyme [candidate division KSB1 bacterium]